MPSKVPSVTQSITYLELPDEVGDSLRQKTLRFISKTKKKNSHHEFANLTDTSIVEYAREFIQNGAGEKYWNHRHKRKLTYPQDETRILEGVTNLMLTQRNNKKKLVHGKQFEDVAGRSPTSSACSENEESSEEDGSEHSAESDLDYIHVASSPATLARPPDLGPGSQELIADQSESNDTRKRSPRRSQRLDKDLPNPKLTVAVIRHKQNISQPLNTAQNSRSISSDRNPQSTALRAIERALESSKERRGTKRRMEFDPDAEELIRIEPPNCTQPLPVSTLRSEVSKDGQELTNKGQAPQRRTAVCEQSFNGLRSDTHRMPDIQARIVRHLQRVQDKYLRMTHAEDLSTETRRECSTLARSYERTIPEVEALFRAAGPDATDEEKSKARKVLEKYY